LESRGTATANLATATLQHL